MAPVTRKFDAAISKCIQHIAKQERNRHLYFPLNSDLYLDINKWKPTELPTEVFVCSYDGPVCRGWSRTFWRRRDGKVNDWTYHEIADRSWQM